MNLMRIELKCEVHAYGEEKSCDWCFEKGDSLYGSEIIRALLKLQANPIYMEIDSETKVNDIISKIIDNLDVPSELKQAPISIYYLIEDERYIIENKELLFLPIATKYFNIYDTSSLHLYLLLNCNAGALKSNDDSLRYYMHSKESGKHNKPHVHVCDRGRNYEASLDLENGSILAGFLPKRLHKKAKEYIINENSYFYDCWEKMTDGLIPDINKHFNLINY